MDIPKYGYLSMTPQDWAIYFPKKQLPNPKALIKTSIFCGPNSEFKIPVRVGNPTKGMIPIQLSKKEKTIKAGPFVGLFTVSGRNGMFKGNYKFLSSLIMAAKKKGVFMFVFTPEGMDIKRKKINGYHYFAHKQSSKWKKVTVPLPDVVYNRVPSRKEEMLPHVQEAFTALSSIRNLSLFNPHYFDKWELYKLLSSKPDLKAHLPPTAQLSTIDQLSTFIAKHDEVYLKPVRSKAGAGIALLKKTENGFDFITQSKGSRFVKKLGSIGNVWQEVQPLINKRSYIMQKAIELSLYENSPFDLRVLCQKNHMGQWGVTGIGMRHAGSESITTHVPQGGKIQDPKIVLQKVFGQSKSRALLTTAERIALKLAHGIERETNKLIGEMSMDLGLDKSGKFWFFEANAKPMKFDEPEIRERSVARILQFCNYLSKMS